MKIELQRTTSQLESSKRELQHLTNTMTTLGADRNDEKSRSMMEELQKLRVINKNRD